MNISLQMTKQFHLLSLAIRPTIVMVSTYEHSDDNGISTDVKIKQVFLTKTNGSLANSFIFIFVVMKSFSMDKWGRIIISELNTQINENGYNQVVHF